MNEKKWKILNSILMIANGVICIMFSEKLLYALPTICGLVMVIKGLIGIVRGINNRDYASLERVGLERAIVVLLVGIGIIVRQGNALFIVGVFWGLYGLRKAADYLNEGLYRRYNNERYIRLILKAIAESVLSIILIFDPYTSIGHHVVILGVELILDSVLEMLPDNE